MLTKTTNRSLKIEIDINLYIATFKNRGLQKGLNGMKGNRVTPIRS